MNIVGISGTLGKPVEVIKLDEETIVLNNTIKVFRNPKSEKFDWINILAYGEMAEYIKETFQMNDFVVVQGVLRTRGFLSKEDEKRLITEVLVYQIEGEEE